MSNPTANRGSIPLGSFIGLGGGAKPAAGAPDPAAPDAGPANTNRV